MELSKRLLVFLLASSLFAKEDEGKLHALYLMQQNQVAESIGRYREFVDRSGRNDFEALQQMGLILLQKGIQSDDPQTFLMTLFGAGLSGSASALDILEKGLAHPDPQMQLISLHFIAKVEDDRAQEIINTAMSSDYLAIRMEAAFYLAQRKHPHAAGQIEGLMFRLPPMFKPYFPSLFALLGTSDGTHALRRLLEDPDPQVRVESILNVAKLGRDDFLPMLRKRLSHNHIAELEAIVFAIGVLKDSVSIPKLRKLASTSTESVRLSASLALAQFGDRSYVSQIIQMAENYNLFAIRALGGLTETEEALAKLVRSSDLQVRINAAAALLERRDPRCVHALSELLIEDARDIVLQPFLTVGKTMMAFKAVPSAELHSKDPSVDFNYSQAIREQLLREAIHLPEPQFLQIGKRIFLRQQNDLVPTLITLLENLQTPGAIALLKEGAAKLAAPFIRDYCHLSLYRLKQEGSYEEHVNNWVMKQKETELIRLRPLLPWKYRMEQSDYSLTPEETSRLLIETFLSIANRRDEKSIGFLLKALQYGKAQNRYALMGLLMKATE